jgi:hypothetical protein
MHMAHLHASLQNRIFDPYQADRSQQPALNGTTALMLVPTKKMWMLS